MSTLKTLSSNHAPAPLGPLVVLEGMPGAGKTTAVTALAAEGRQVVGEYTTAGGVTIPVTDHPAVDDDHAHQANWLIKHRHTSTVRRSGPVFCDRDWLSALAYAASLEDGGLLLRSRAAWAGEHLHRGALAVAKVYVVFGLDPDTSLARRAGRLTPGHPWSTRAGLQHVAAFYADPLRAVAAVDEDLGRALHTADWHQLPASSIEKTLRHLSDLVNRS